MWRTRVSLIKTSIFFSFIIFNSINLFAQIHIKVKIIDSENGAPIPYVTILNIENTATFISNASGEFEVTDIGAYKLLKIGYLEKTIDILKSGYIIVQLEANPLELNEIIVSANHIPQKLKKAVATINIISSQDIKRGNDINVTSIFNQVPGVFMQTGSLNTNKISIRGIGSRNLYGTSKIRAYFGDIPLTNGNGETTIEDFELGSISRFEINKGAASSIYGSGLGGAIHLIPQNAYLNQTNAEGQVSIGSYGLIKGLININHGTEKNSIRAIYSNTHSDGYRNNNEYNRQTFTINSNHFVDKKNELSFLASYVDLKAFIPSSIDEDTYKNNPTKAAFTWAQSQGYEDSQRGIFGATWNHQYDNKIKQITSVFSSFKEAYEPRPFNILTENTSALGVRSRLLCAAEKLNWTLGGELFTDWYKSGTFENLYQDFPAGTGSVQGDALSDFKERRSYYNLFFESNYNLSEKTTLSLGINYNKTLYHLKDRFVTPENPDQSGSYDFNGMASPKFGVSHVFSENITLYSNISHGFSPPTTNETLLPEGLINTNIKPESGWNHELGTRMSLYNNRLQLNLAVYKMNIKNLLVARRTTEDQFIGLNAGKTIHNGLELSINYQWIESDAVSLKQFLSYTANDFTFKEFIDGDTNFSGNKLTGVPSNVFNTGLDLNTQFGLYGSLSFQHTGPIPITDSNALFTDSYNLSNIKIGFQYSIRKKIKLKAFFGLDNIFNEGYASQILINATGFGGSAPRYYYPGNPANYYTGLHINYSF